MNVIAICGSPRINGNTSILINEVFEELNKEGISTELLNIAHKPVNGCISCFKCLDLKNEQCIFKNDIVNEIVQKMKNADGIILASPVYYADLSGQMKSFLDRAFFVCGANGGLLKRKVGASIAVARRAGATTTLNSLNHYFLISEMFVVGSSYWNLAFGRSQGEVSEDAEGLETMRNLGKNMAFAIKSFHNNKSSSPNTLKTAWTNFIR